MEAWGPYRPNHGGMEALQTQPWAPYRPNHGGMGALHTQPWGARGPYRPNHGGTGALQIPLPAPMGSAGLTLLKIPSTAEFGVFFLLEISAYPTKAFTAISKFLLRESFSPFCSLKERLDCLNPDIKVQFLKSLPQINLLCFPPRTQHISSENRHTLPGPVRLQQISICNNILQ